MIKHFDCRKYDYNTLPMHFKSYVEKHNCPEVFVDLSDFNIIDAMKFILISSAYHCSKYPSGRIKCHIASNEIKNYIKTFATSNLELV